MKCLILSGPTIRFSMTKKELQDKFVDLSLALGKEAKKDETFNSKNKSFLQLQKLGKEILPFIYKVITIKDENLLLEQDLLLPLNYYFVLIAIWTDLPKEDLIRNLTTTIDLGCFGVSRRSYNLDKINYFRRRCEQYFFNRLVNLI